jgi:hypothetical protein
MGVADSTMLVGFTCEKPAVAQLVLRHSTNKGICSAGSQQVNCQLLILADAL